MVDKNRIDKVLDVGQLEEMAAILKGAAEKDPESHDVQILYGVTQLLLNHLEEAEDRFRKILEKWPKSVPAYDKLGLIYLTRGEAAKSLEYFEKALEIDQKFSSAYVNTAKALFILNREEEAERSVLRALELKVGDVEALKLLAQIYLRSGRKKEGVRVYRNILKQSPDELDVLLPLARLHLEAGDPYPAVDMYGRILQALPDQEEARAAIAELHLDNYLDEITGLKRPGVVVSRPGIPADEVKVKSPVVFEKVVFYNHYHYGDIHVSRSYVKYLMSAIQSKKYVYSHKNPAKLLLDVDGLEHDPLYLYFLDMNARYILDEKMNTLYINTWYANSDSFGENNCTLNTLHDLFDGLMRDLFGVAGLPGDITSFLPQIDYQRYEIGRVDAFMESNREKKKVFLSNNNVLSGQSRNFDFDPVIDHLSDKYPDVLFLITNKMGRYFDKPNTFYTGDIIAADGNDLNENAYVSTFCRLIVGRLSGAYSFSYTKDNLMDEKKRFLCFCNNEAEALWVHPPGLIKARIVWKGSYEYDDVVAAIDEEIRKL